MVQFVRSRWFAVIGWALFPVTWILRPTSSAPEYAISEAEVWLEDLERREAALDSRLATLLERVTEASFVSVAAATETSADSLFELTQKMERVVGTLEAALVELLNRGDYSAGVGWTNKSPEELAELVSRIRAGIDAFPRLNWLSSHEELGRPEIVQRLLDVVRDPHLDAKERLEALAALALAEQRSANTLRDASVCASALELSLALSEVGDRERLFASLVGTKDLGVRATLLQQSLIEPSAAVRDTQVVVLGSFLPDPEVESLLRRLRESDPSAAVRDEADEVLKKHGH